MAKQYLNKSYQSSGFTIVELLIASAVFSVVLIGALAGFMQIGRVFYKGTSLAATQETARQILADVSDSVQIAPANSITGILTEGEVKYFCAGATRYTYFPPNGTTGIARAVDTSQTDSFSSLTKFGLIRDKLPSPDCQPPCPQAPAVCGSNQTAWASPIELLGDNMRLQELKVQTVPSISSDYYTISVVVAFGDDDLFDLPSGPSSIQCSGSVAKNEQFCAVARYSTSVKRGLDF